MEVAEENEVVEDGDDQPTRVEVPVEPPPAPPEADNNSGGRYNLRGGWSRSYNHHYTGEDFVIDNENGIVMATKGTSEVFETLQMSLKAGLRVSGSDCLKAVEKEMRQLHDQDVMTQCTRIA